MPILRYEITQAHIDAGCANDEHRADNCPNYQAAIDGIRALGWNEARFRGAKLDLYVDNPNFYPDAAARVYYPEHLYTWINHYDLGNPVAPITVELEIPAGPGTEAG